MKVTVIILLFGFTLAMASFCGKFECPPGWTKYEDHCYRFYNQPRKSYAGAEDFCGDLCLDPNGGCKCNCAHLVQIDTAAEQEFLLEWWITMREPVTTRQSSYIGYNDIAQEGNWVWPDGTSGSFTNWENQFQSVQQPDNYFGNQDCAVMWKLEDSLGITERGAWDDQQCYIEHAFICEYEP